MENNKIHTVTKEQVKKKTIIAFVLFFTFICLGIFLWKWVNKQPDDMGIVKPLRNGLNADEVFFSNFLSPDHLAKTFPVTAAVHHPRVNGEDGMGVNFNPADWKLHLIRNAGDSLLITLADLKALPKTEIIFDFKCIEGWSEVSHWGGVKFSDFAKKYGLTDQVKMKYASLVTPDSGYYVGIDMASMMHPQTMLCYEVNGEPLPLKNGYPLRLIIPVKYGIKNLKRIGTISFSNERPRDYWYERGYDYYSGL